jgi:hypothetical protein
MPRRSNLVPGKAGPGRPKGSPNKVTRDARAALAAFLDESAPRAVELWKKVAKRDPARALELINKLGDYVIPKLARTEVSGPGGGPIPTATATANISDDEAMKVYMQLVGQKDGSQ